MIQDVAAETIAEDLLYQTGKALLAGDDDMFIACLHLPQLMETGNGRRLIRSEDEVRQVLRDLRAFMKKRGVVDMVRTVVSAEFLDADTVGSTHVCLLVQKDGSSTRAPYPVYTIIKRFGPTWLMVSSLYAILDSDEHNDVLLSCQELSGSVSKGE